MPPAALIGVGLAASAASGAVGAAGQRKAGKQEQQAAYAEAAQLEVQAGQERALGQREAVSIEEQARRLVGRQRADLANSGFAADDITAQSITQETRRIATLDQLLALAQREDQARQLVFEAQQTRTSGDRARSASKRAAFGTILGTASSFTSQFGALRK